MTREMMSPSSWRNIGIIAHIDAGKTTLSERLLWKTGAVHRTGEVHDGTATMDHMDLERERGITIGAAATQTVWHSPRNPPHRVTLIDTPGHIDFSIEVERSLRVLDGAVAVFCAVGGVQPQSETVWRQAKKHNIPLVAFVNKMDRIGADFDRVLAQMRTQLQATVVPVVVPVNKEADFDTVIDVVNQQTWHWDHDGARTSAWTAQEQTEHASARQAVIDAVADHNDAVLEAVINNQTVNNALLRAAVREATLAGHIVPILAGSAFKNKGIEPLLDAVVDFLPAPFERHVVAQHNSAPETVACNNTEPLAGLVFKVLEQTHGSLAFVRLYRGNMKPGDQVVVSGQDRAVRVGRLCTVLADRTQDISMAQAGEIVAVVGWNSVRTGDSVCAPEHIVELERITTHEPVLAWRLRAERNADTSKLAGGLERLLREDPSLRTTTDQISGDIVLWGMGELHLDVAVERLRREYGVGVAVGTPTVAYCETPSAVVPHTEARIVKQTGGSGQFAVLVIGVRPRTDQEVVVHNKTTGGVLPKEFAQAAEKGIRDALAAGPLGHKVVGVDVVLLDAQTHAVDSSAQAFHRAGMEAIKNALLASSTTILEPIMRIHVEAPETMVGDVIGDLQRRSGQVQQITSMNGWGHVDALVPLAQLTAYTTGLRSLTQGRGHSQAVLDGYAVQPPQRPKPKHG